MGKWDRATFPPSSAADGRQPTEQKSGRQMLLQFSQVFLTYQIHICLFDSHHISLCTCISGSFYQLSLKKACRNCCICHWYFLLVISSAVQIIVLIINVWDIKGEPILLFLIILIITILILIIIGNVWKVSQPPLSWLEWCDIRANHSRHRQNCSNYRYWTMCDG